MMSAAHRFHAQLLSGTASWSRIPQHLPQLLDIVQSNAEFGESTTQELDFFKTAWRWACDNPTIAWEDTTQEVFATAFRKKLEDKDARSTKELLQAWTRGGVQDPSGENQQRIRDFFHLCDSAMARRLLETAPYVSQYLTDNQATRDDWLDDALYRVKMQLPS